MMVYKVKYKNYENFLEALKNGDWNLIEKITYSVLSAIRKKRKTTQVFEIETEDNEIIDFIVEEKEYIKVLTRCLNEHINRELYEKCSEIKKAIDSFEKV